jgi:hypothetical protein
MADEFKRLHDRDVSAHRGAWTGAERMARKLLPDEQEAHPNIGSSFDDFLDEEGGE